MPPPIIEEDFEAWEYYKEHRWVFNKLEVALRLGYDAGPTGTRITEAKHYIVRPIYNLYGMGIGAKKIYMTPETHNEELLQCKHVPPGYFWCEYFTGQHYSVDFIKEEGKWKPFSSMVGFHKTEDNLVQFDYWEVVEPVFELPDFLHNIDTQKYLNIESKDDKIFEIHLRSGNDHIWDLPVGSKVYPVWEGEDSSHLSHLEWRGNHVDDRDYYTAGGLIDNIRTGYYVEVP